MKYCYACGHKTQGEPLYCNSCGRSYDAKLCSKLHVNPRAAAACSQCGSRDLSIPQPKIPVLWVFLALLAQAVFGLLCLSLSLPLIVAFLNDAARRSPIPDRLFLGMFVLVLLWALWVMLPDLSRRIIRRSLIKKSGLSNHQNSH
jgi:hypothetical protein